MQILFCLRCLVIALLGVLILALPGRAEPRFTYRVINVAADDPDGLNVRDSVIEAQSVADTAIVGSLAWNARGIRTSGREVEIAGSPWLEIKLGSVEGWVNAKYLARESGFDLPEIAPDKLICSGTEPFWGLKLSVKPAIYLGADWPNDEWVEDVQLDMLASDEIVEQREGHWAVTLKRQSKNQYLRAVISKARPLCDDGMSNLLYPYEIVVLKGRVPRPVYGCCYIDINK